MGSASWKKQRSPSILLHLLHGNIYDINVPQSPTTFTTARYLRISLWPFQTANCPADIFKLILYPVSKIATSNQRQFLSGKQDVQSLSVLGPNSWGFSSSLSKYLSNFFFLLSRLNSKRLQYIQNFRNWWQTSFLLGILCPRTFLMKKGVQRSTLCLIHKFLNPIGANMRWNFGFSKLLNFKFLLKVDRFTTKWHLAQNTKRRRYLVRRKGK